MVHRSSRTWRSCLPALMWLVLGRQTALGADDPEFTLHNYVEVKIGDVPTTFWPNPLTSDGSSVVWAHYTGRDSESYFFTKSGEGMRVHDFLPQARPAWVDNPHKYARNQEPESPQVKEAFKKIHFAAKRILEHSPAVGTFAVIRDSAGEPIGTVGWNSDGRGAAWLDDQGIVVSFRTDNKFPLPRIPLDRLPVGIAHIVMTERGVSVVAGQSVIWWPAAPDLQIAGVSTGAAVTISHAQLIERADRLPEPLRPTLSGTRSDDVKTVVELAGGLTNVPDRRYAYLALLLLPASAP